MEKKQPKELEDLYIAVSELLTEIFAVGQNRQMNMWSPEVQALYTAEIKARRHFRDKVTNYSTDKRINLGRIYGED